MAASAATAVTVRFPLGETVLESAVSVDEAVGGISTFAAAAAVSMVPQTQTGVSFWGAATAPAVTPSGSVALLSSIKTLSSAMQAWSEVRRTRAESFRLALFRADDPSEARLAHAFASEAARFVSIQAPFPLSVRTLPTQPAAVGTVPSVNALTVDASAGVASAASAPSA